MENQSRTYNSLDMILEERIKAICTHIFAENIRLLKDELRDNLLGNYLTIHQVADILGKDVRTIKRYEKKGLKGYKIGRSYIYFEEDVKEFVEHKSKANSNNDTAQGTNLKFSML